MKIKLAILLSIFSQTILAQKDSTIPLAKLLNPVAIISSKLQNFCIGTSLQNIDSTALQLNAYQSMANLLKMHSFAFLKTNGTTGLASFSIRGSNASQVATIWNGMNINMLSQSMLDANLIPAFATDNIQVQYGGGSVLWGNGAVGASVHLQSNTPHFLPQNHLQINIQKASYNSHTLQAKHQISTHKLYLQSKYYWHQSTNNFKIMNPQIGYHYQSNSAKYQQAFLQDFGYKINNNTTLDAHLWLQHTYRQLPPTTTTISSVQNQTDNHIRFLCSAKSLFKNRIVTSKLGSSYEYLLYKDAAINLSSTYYTTNIFAEHEQEFLLKKKYGKLYANTQYIFGKINAKEYNGNPTQHKVAASVLYKNTLAHHKLNIQAGLRAEKATLFTPAWVANAGLEYSITKNQKLLANIGRCYKLPSFNDLFWYQGGNTNLKPEFGLAYEFTTLNQFAITTQSICKTSLTYFNRNINDWISWVPTNNIWHPENILKVKSNGLEAQITWVANIANTIKNTTSILYTYTQSIRQKTEINNLSSLHKQLIYTPKTTAKINHNMQCKYWQYNINTCYTGLQYTTSDNKQNIKPFWVINMDITKKIPTKKNYLNLSFGIQNLANKNYYPIAFVPMPKRNYYLQLSTQLF